MVWIIFISPYLYLAKLKVSVLVIIMSNVMKCHQMSSDFVNCHQMSWNFMKCHQDIIRLNKMPTNVIKNT